VIAGLRKVRPSDTIQLPNVSVSWARPVWPFALGTPLPLEPVDCQNDLLFLAFAEGDRLDVRLQYRSAQFTRRFAEELAEHLALQPEAPALLMRELVLSYGEMERLTNRIAHGLRRRGVKPNRRWPAWLS
jgi:hypothetical protein